MKTLYQLAENENIQIIDDKLLPNVNGIYYRNGSNKLIFLKKYLRRAVKRITLAEEIGHHFTSYGNVCFQSRGDFTTCSKNEYLARKWAAKTLIPDDQFKKILNHDEEAFDLNIKQIADELEVTPEFIRFRFNILKNSY